MNILKKLSILGCFSLITFYGNLDDAISNNEELINFLQESINSLQTKGAKEKLVGILKKQMDDVIQKQNMLLEKKVAEGEAQTIISDTSPIDKSLQSALDIKEDANKPGLNQQSTNPYDEHNTEGNRAPTPAELEATKTAQENSPDLPEGKSEAFAQYEVALRVYNKGAYREAAAGFGRIVKNYPKDPISGKAMVHLAFCLESQSQLDKASVVCQAALQKIDLDDVHKTDCQIVRYHAAHEQESKEEAEQIMNDIDLRTLTKEQKGKLEKITGKTLTPPKTFAEPKKVKKPANAAKVSEA